MMNFITVAPHITSFVNGTINREEFLQFILFKFIRIEAFKLDAIFFRFNISIILLLLINCPTDMCSPDQYKYK